MIFLDAKIFIIISVLILISTLCWKSAVREEFPKICIVPFTMVSIISTAATFFSLNIYMLNSICFAIPLIYRDKRLIAPILIIGTFLIPEIGTNVSIGSLYLLKYTSHESFYLGSMLSLLMNGGSLKSRKYKFDVPFLLIMALFIFIDFRGTEITNIFRVVLYYVLVYGLPYFVVSRSIYNKENINYFLSGLIYIGIVLSAILLFEFLKNWSLYMGTASHFGIDNLAGTRIRFRAGFLRASGPFLDSISIALTLVMLMMAAFASRALFKTSLQYWGTVIFLFAGLVAPQARNAFIGIIAALLAVAIYRATSKSIARVMSSVLFLICSLAGLKVLGIVTGLGPFATNDYTRGTTEYRVQLFEAGMREFWKKPLSGYSSPELMINMEHMRQGEGIIDFVNTYLYIGLASGGFGLALFSACLISVPVLLWQWRVQLRADPVKERLAALVFGVSLAIIAMLPFTSFVGKYPVLFLCLTGTLGVLRPVTTSKSSPRSAAAA